MVSMNGNFILSQMELSRRTEQVGLGNDLISHRRRSIGAYLRDGELLFSHLVGLNGNDILLYNANERGLGNA